MDTAIPHGSSLAAFFVASLALAVMPGPAVFYIVTRALSQGRRAGLTSVGAVALGNLGNSIGASVGLAALFSISTLAFWVVKYAGAAYLIYLGAQALRRPAQPVREAPLEGARPARVFRDGFTVALLNPKTALFFSAFLPQFFDPGSSALLQGLVLGAVFVLVASCTDTAYALAASAVAPAMRRARGGLNMGRYLTASALIGLGVFTATSGARHAK